MGDGGGAVEKIPGDGLADGAAAGKGGVGVFDFGENARDGIGCPGDAFKPCKAFGGEGGDVFCAGGGVELADVFFCPCAGVFDSGAGGAHAAAGFDPGEGDVSVGAGVEGDGGGAVGDFFRFGSGGF